MTSIVFSGSAPVIDQQCVTTSSIFNNLAWGYATGTSRVAQSFTPAVTGNAAQMTIRGSKTGSPTDNVRMDLYTTDAFGLPVTLLGTSPTIINGATLTGSPADITFDFTSLNLLLNSGVQRAWVLRRDGAIDASNSYLVSRTNGTDDYPGGSGSYYNGSVWSGSGDDRYFQEYYTPVAKITGVSSITL